ncbi:MAG: phosphotransferase [Oscillospiraceae bacterium]|nr:phosphotransferase [Oscillospiraceae bacterium]
MDLSKATVMAVRPNKTVYRYEDVTIKVMTPEYSACDVLNEAMNLAIVQETGFRVPTLREVRKIDGCWAIIYDYIQGVSLDKMMTDDPKNTKAYFERFVDLQIEMHSYTADRLKYHTDKMKMKINQSGLDATQRYDLHMRLDGLPKHKKLCHGDYTPGNVIITPDDEAYVIDWSHATQGNASADAARTYLRHKLAGRDDYAEMYMDLFCKKSDTARQYVQKWLAIVASSQLVKKIPEQRDFLLSWVNFFEFE